MKSGIGMIFAAAFGAGVGVFLASNVAEAAHSEAVILYRFTGGADGSEPRGPLIADSSGNLYGTTSFGGGAKDGVVFELSPSNGAWQESVLHSFNGSDGKNPVSGLTLDSQGNLYGTTFNGGPQGGGVVFEVSPAGNGRWNYSLLYGFGGPQSGGGSNPNGNLVRDPSGNLYGTTQLGGTVGCTNFPGPCGVVFEVSPSGGGNWTETPIYSFAGAPDGAFPYAGVVLDASGNLYGTTSEGGPGKCNDGEGTVIGCGTVFRLQPQGAGWSETHLYDFKVHEENMPGAPLVFGENGTLYTAVGYDVVRFKPPAKGGTSWSKEVLYQFTEGIAGTIPSGGVAFDAKGNLYGTTASSGLEGFSTAFKLSPNGGGFWANKTLAKFAKDFRSNQPEGGLLVSVDDTLYGAVAGTSGYIFAIVR